MIVVAAQVRLRTRPAAAPGRTSRRAQIAGHWAGSLHGGVALTPAVSNYGLARVATINQLGGIAAAAAPCQVVPVSFQGATGRLEAFMILEAEAREHAADLALPVVGVELKGALEQSIPVIHDTSSRALTIFERVAASEVVAELVGERAPASSEVIHSRAVPITKTRHAGQPHSAPAIVVTPSEHVD